MREIKFRAYDTRINTMYPYVKLCWNGSIEARLDPDDPSTVADITMRHANGDHDDYGGEIVVMQFTSLKDKNGKEICESDIVKSTKEYNSYSGLNSELYGGNKYEIKNNGWRFYLAPAPIFSCSPDLECLEIIGNVYENPDLLK